MIYNYTENRAFKNAVEDDLWKALNDQAITDGVVLPSSMKAIMDTWTLQMGYPVVSVVRNYESNSATVSQVNLYRKFNFLNIHAILFLKTQRNDSYCEYPKNHRTTVMFTVGGSLLVTQLRVIQAKEMWIGCRMKSNLNQSLSKNQIIINGYSLTSIKKV